MSSPAAHRAELLWCLHGPRLARPSGLQELDLDAESTRQLSLADWPALPRRLGRRFELIWGWALGRLPGWQVIAEEIQVQDNKRTLGALDLLAQHHERVVHLELAVKFYLCRRGQSGKQASDWVGPNKRDRLDLRLDRMRTHQLPMGQRPATHAMLHRLGLPRPDTSLAVLRGVCFSDWRAPESGGAGRWCLLNELEDAVSEAHVLERTQWLGGHGAVEMTGGRALRTAVEDQLSRGAVQLVDGSGMRVMVLPPAWTES